MSSTPRAPRRAVRVAIGSGLLGLLCFLALPFLPVTQSDASVHWPQDGSLNSVAAPLTAYSPQRLHAEIPCTLVREVPDGILLSTTPEGGEKASQRSLFVRAGHETVDVVARGRLIASAPREQAQNCHSIVVDAGATGVTADFRGIDGAAREVHADDLRPLVTGVYTDLPAATAVPAGLDVVVDVDSRFTSSPTWIKWAAMAIGLVATVVALVALHVLDRTDGRRDRRALPRGWFRPRLPDVAVVGTLLIWHVIGGNTSDDGYILTMARAAEPSGYMANYYRWYGVPESPFGSPYYDLLTAFAHISTASPWMRLPALLAGICCWLVISREVLPRLGRAARTTPVVVWSAAAVFLAFWTAFDNGLRPEPVIALGALLTWTSVERAIATRRMVPFALAVLVASFSLAAGPTGLMAVAALAMGLRPVLRTVVERGRRLGSHAALVMPVLAAGTAVLICVFGNQTLASVREAIRVRGEIGPSLHWYEEFIRYYYLMIQTVDGSLSRRLPVLLVLLCLLVVLATLLRRGRIPGAAKGPAWRLVGVIFGTAALMTFSPTKWTHHFGVYAGIGAAIAALGAMAISHTALRSPRNRTVFLGVVLVVLALAAAGTDGWWYVSSFGIMWWDKAPSLHGIDASSVLLVLAVITFCLAAWQHLRQDYVTEHVPSTRAGRNRVRTLAAAPIAVVAGLLVVFSVAVFCKGLVKQYPAYSVGLGNARALTGSPCMLADAVRVEPDPNQGMLAPLAGDDSPAAATRTLAGSEHEGFTAGGVASDLSADAVVGETGSANSASDPSSGPEVSTGQNAGTGGGRALPFGLDPEHTPVLGSFRAGAQTEAELRTGWYRLPADRSGLPLLALTAAGRIGHFDADGLYQYGQDVALEFGRSRGTDADPVGTPFVPYDIGPSPTWRTLRVPMSAVPAEADVVRVHVRDGDLAPDQWVAVTPPRAPHLQTLQEYVGSSAPVLLDWAVGLQFPCQRPYSHRDGVAEPPEFRILPDRPLAVGSTSTWQAYEAGGPLGWIETAEEATTVPSYLSEDLNRDWGSLERYRLRRTDADTEPAIARVETTEHTRWGWWKPEAPIFVTDPK